MNMGVDFGNLSLRDKIDDLHLKKATKRYNTS
jgi:hypothetical protein